MPPRTPHKADAHKKQMHVANKVLWIISADKVLKPEITDYSKSSQFALRYTCPHRTPLNFRLSSMPLGTAIHKYHACSLHNTLQALSANSSIGNVRYLCMTNRDGAILQSIPRVSSVKTQLIHCQLKWRHVSTQGVTIRPCIEPCLRYIKWKCTLMYLKHGSIIGLMVTPWVETCRHFNWQ